MTRWLLVVLALAPGCSSNTGLGYRNLNVEATHADGSAVDGFPEDGCTTLPLLLGSRDSARFELDDTARIEVDATRDEARVVIAAAGYDETLSADQLESGFSDQIQFTAPSGAEYVVSLGSSCPAVTTP
jgi:hypothetical protein